MEDFDFTFQPSIDKRQIDELAALAFAARTENVIFMGPPGVSNDPSSSQISVKSAGIWYGGYYTTLSHLIEDLKKAQVQGKLDRWFCVYLRPSVLVIDEIGYSRLARQEAELFFRLVSDRYEYRSIILISNKYFSDWGELLSDNVLATALLDRLLHHAHVINIRGQTYRLKDLIETGIHTVPPVSVPAELNRRFRSRLLHFRRLGHFLPDVFNFSSRR